jgi:hypothetical protein
VSADQRAKRRVFLRPIAILLLGSAMVTTSSVSAEDPPTLSGTWTASAMREVWSTSEWGEACGAKPSAQGGAPGGSVVVIQQGSELSFSGAGRSYSTTQCWEPMPGLMRTSHSGGQRGWTSTCTSRPGDPRIARVTTNISANDDTITFNETGTFEGRIKDSVCKASVSRSRSYKLVQRADATPSSSSAPATPSVVAPPTTTPKPPPREPDPPPQGCEPDAAPARFIVRPTRKLLRPGESFVLDAKVLDARGCKLSNPTIVIDEGSALDGYLHVDGLTVSAREDAPEVAGDVQVTLGARKIPVSVEITPASRYEALLVERGLNARGEDDTASAIDIEATVSADPSTAEDSARQRRRTFLVIVGGVAAALGVVALAFWRRGKRRPPVERATEAPPLPNVMLFESTTSAASMGCPKCESSYPTGTGFCASDGAALVPSKRPVAPAIAEEEAPVSSDRPSRAKVEDLAKICPTCGDRFVEDAGFCGKDGTQLVPIN